MILYLSFKNTSPLRDWTWVWKTYNSIIRPTRTVYMSHATRPLLSLSSLGGDALTSGADAVAVGASLTRRRVSGGSRHAPMSIRAHTAALTRVTSAKAICTDAITTRSREGGLASSSADMSLKNTLHLLKV